MKKLLVISAFLPWGQLFSASISEFQKLIQQNKLEVRVLSTGAYQEDCLQFFITNKSNASIHLQLQPGMQFNSQTETEQDLILTSTIDKVLAAGAKLVCIGKAYCFQASRGCPSKGGKYTLFDKQDTGLSRVAEFLAKRGFAPHINQNAIWTVSDHHSIAAIPDTSEALQSLRVLLARLSNQVIPWYRTDYAHIRTAGGHIGMLPLQLTTNITFSLPQLNYITVQLVDEQGRPAGFILQHWQQPGTELSYPISFSTKNLVRGKYSLVVSTDKETLFRKDLEV